MRIVTNKKLARRNRQLTSYLFFGTFGALILGFIFINSALVTGEEPSNLIILAQAAILPVAFILTIISVRMTNLWAREPRPENAIAEGLKGLSNKSVLYNYYHFPARHVLICPQGVFAIVTRWHDQKFLVKDGKFSSRRNMISKFFSSMRFDGVGRPFQEAEHAKDRVMQQLQEIAPDVVVQPLVVFIDSKAEIEIEGQTEIPVLYADPKNKLSLKLYLRDVKRQLASEQTDKTNADLMPLTDAQIEAFEQATVK
jgi:hypothetical protein